jgi:hypothetical protein
MFRKKTLLSSFAALVIALLFFLAYRHWQPRNSDTERADLLSLMPADAGAVIFLDVRQLRTSPFLQQIWSWAPAVTPDGDYAQFVQATGFDYERDLDRAAVALHRRSETPWIFAIVEGHFDRKKIEAYANRFGSLKTADGKTLFSVPISGSQRKAYFMFLRDDRIAWANDSSCFFQRPLNGSLQAWREHFSRVAGTPMLAVLQEDFVPAGALDLAPGGFRSPQLATLLAQLQWITISAKPEGNVLRVVIDGESVSESAARQLKEVLSGLAVLAQVGLSDARTRSQLDPEVRQGYLDLLQSADIQELDRGTSKSVRVIFDVAPKLLQPARTVSAPAGTDLSPDTRRDIKKKYAQR